MRKIRLPEKESITAHFGPGETGRYGQDDFFEGEARLSKVKMRTL
jgi:hypothetical protein